MIRVLFVVAVAALIAVALTSLHAALTQAGVLARRPRAAPPAPYMTKASAMPAALRHVSYALLLALMFGIVTGWIGG